MVKLTITFTDRGTVALEGPLQDKIFCFGLLEMAKEAVRNYGTKDEPRVLIPEVVSG